MKIAFVLNDGSLYEGSIKSFLTLFKMLRNTGIETLVFTPNKKELYQYLTSSYNNVFCVPIRHNIFPNQSLLKNPLAYVKFFIRKIYDIYASILIFFKCKKEKVDIIHSNSSVLTAGYRAAKLLKVPHITHIREYGDLDFNLKLPHLSRQLNSKRNYSIAITQGIAAHRPSKNIKVIYNGIFDQHNILKILPKQNYFLFAGRIEYSKGIDILIDAFILFCKKNPDNTTILKITGDFQNESTIKLKTLLTEKLTATNTAGRVEWIGKRSDVQQLMANALATIIPSRFEAFGRVMPEALINGCLVVGKNTGGTKEQFDNGLKFSGSEIGFRFDTTEELANILSTIVSTEYSQFETMIRHGYETVMHNYSIQNYFKSTLDYYNSILKCHE